MFKSFDLHIYRRGWSHFFLCIAGLILLSMFTTPVAYGIACGDEIRTSIKLTADLGPCPGNGLIIAGPLTGDPNITIDLNGYSILGSGTHFGLWIVNGGAVVKSGFIRNFGEGIRMDHANDVMVYDLQLYNNAAGINILFSGGIRVFDNTLLGQTAGTSGISTSDVHDAFVYRNTIREHSGFAVHIGLGFSTVSENLIEDNDAGIFVGGDGDSTVRGNRIFNNKGNAIEVRFTLGGGNCFIENNDIDWNAGNGVVVDGNSTHDCRVRNNRIRHSQLNGISIIGGNGHQITGNRLARNGLDLFWDGAAGACWRQNVYSRSMPLVLPLCPDF
ncbi:MAG: right-handed parallel beta-helix repeat-containing protein [Acidobacteriia bacterium]|nr:right-handed parallel beta-helix repeat-containing protein [Terriglobia bacterium]